MKINSIEMSSAKIIFVFCLIFFLYSTISTAFLNLKIFSDFPTYYSAAIALRNDQNIYQHDLITNIAVHYVTFGKDIGSYNYPPLLAQLFIPLSFLSYPIAKTVWTLVLLFLLFLIGRKFLELKLGDNWSKNCWLLFALSLLSFPLGRVLVHGQLEILVLYGALLSWHFYKKNKKISTGIVIGLISVIKIYPLILLLYFLVRSEKKLIITSLVTIFIVGGISLVALPKSTSASLFDHTIPALLQGQAAEQTVAGNPSYAGTKYWPNNYALSGLFAHTLTQQAVTTGFVNKPDLATKLSYFFSALIFIIMMLTLIKNRRLLDPLIYFYILLGFLLIVPLAWEYYLVLALPSLILLIHKKLQKPTENKQLIILAIILAIISLEIYYWRPWLLQGWGTIFMSAKTLSLIALFVIATSSLWRLNKDKTIS